METRGRSWVMLGGVLIGVAAVAPWLGDSLASQWGLSVPLALAFDLDTSATAPPIGIVLLAAAAVIAVAAVLPWAWPFRQVAGAAVVLLTVAIAVQVARFSMELEAGLLGILNPLGAGAYLALAGGLLALLVPRPQPGAVPAVGADAPTRPTPPIEPEPQTGRAPTPPAEHEPEPAAEADPGSERSDDEPV